MKTLKNSFKISGFTLAEVLITLGIIGIVAAITIPTLVKNFEDMQYKTAYKKAYSTASQAWLQASSDGELTLCDTWLDDAKHCNYNNFIAFKKYFKIFKDCGTDTASCWNMNGEKTWGGAYPTTDALAFIDNSGVAWTKLLTNAAGGEIAIDINGDKKPNQYGKDRFLLTLYYFSFEENDGAKVNGTLHKANIPIVYYFRDFPNAVSNITEEQYRCPSMNTHPCYYSSWLTE